MSIKKWMVLIAACGLMAGLVSAQDATQEATAAATAEAPVATAEAPAATAEAPAATAESPAANADAKTPQELCDAATITEPATRQFEGAETVIEVGVDYRAILCTGAGAVYVDLWEDIAPKTVNNFVFLSDAGYYNNSNFHRVIADFMVQGGDPVGNPPGTGGPGYQFEDEFTGFITFDRPGLLAMANAGAGTNGSQFFVTTAVTDWLNFKHTIFGEVLEGYDTVLSIDVRDPETATEPGESLNTVLIVTDPSTVKTTYQAPASELASGEDAATALGAVTANNPLPEGLVEGEPKGLIAAEDVFASEEGLTDLYTAHDYQYRATLSLNNEACNEGFYFTNLRYSIDAFATSEDATALLTDAALDEVNTAEGFTRQPSFSPVYTRPAQDCAGAETQEGRLYLQRGRYIAIVEGIFPPTLMEQASMEAILSTWAGQFESSLVTLYANER